LSRAPSQVIEAGRRSLLTDIGELVAARELLLFLVWRDVKVRYKQTAIGVVWALLQPLLTMLVFAAVFGRLAQLRGATGGVPYPLYVLSGLLPWIFFATSVSNAGTSLLAGASLVSKVYFPRLLIPLASVGVALVDFAISLLLLVVALTWYGHAPGAQALLSLLFLALAVLAAIGFGAAAAALAVSYRDVRYALPFLIQIWMFATPVVYPPALIPERWRPVFALNPLVGAVDGFRASILGLPVDSTASALAVAGCGVLFVLGLSYFRSVERRFADVI